MQHSTPHHSLTAVVALSALALAVLPAVEASDPVVENPIPTTLAPHGAMDFMGGIMDATPNPHRSTEPEPTITREADGSIRVDTADGPVWIKTCVRPTEDPRAHPEFGPGAGAGGGPVAGAGRGATGAPQSRFRSASRADIRPTSVR